MDENNGNNKDESFFEGVGNEVVVVSVIGAFVIAVALWKIIKGNGDVVDPEAEMNANAAPRRVGTGDAACPVCLAQTQFAVETNCGHVFCASCALEVHARRPQGPLTAAACPYCRQRWTLLIPVFTEAEWESDHEDLISRIREFNRLYGGESRSLGEHLRDLPMLIRHFWHFMWGGNGMYLLFRVRAVVLMSFIALYVLLPFDLVPEAVFGLFGLIDDLLVAVIVLSIVASTFRNFIIQEGVFGN